MRIIFLLAACCPLFFSNSFACNIKEPNVAGSFYPADPTELSQMLDAFLTATSPAPGSGVVRAEGEIFALISPHAGYGFSGQVASYGYNAIKGKSYKTVIIIGPSHYYAFNGVSVFAEGTFRTPLGDLTVDKEFASMLLNKDEGIILDPKAFEKEHSVEVQRIPDSPKEL